MGGDFYLFICLLVTRSSNPIIRRNRSITLVFRPCCTRIQIGKKTTKQTLYFILLIFQPIKHAHFCFSAHWLAVVSIPQHLTPAHISDKPPLTPSLSCCRNTTIINVMLFFLFFIIFILLLAGSDFYGRTRFGCKVYEPG